MKKSVCFFLAGAFWLMTVHGQEISSSSRTAFQERMDSINKITDAHHKRMMKLLHIDSLRPGYNGWSKNAENPPNTDESKANPYPDLPDPLVLNNGKKVTGARMWWEERRPEIEKDFNQDIYGYLPEHIPSVDWKIVDEKRDTEWSVPVITKKIVGHVNNSIDTSIQVNIKLTLTIPAHAGGPVPVMMDFGFVFPPGFKLPGNFPKPTWTPWQEVVLKQGWGYAVLIPTSIQPDNGAGLTEGIIGLCNKGAFRKPDQWGALRAWAWGASRALDYLETDKSVNAREVGIEGVSRYGKAALVTMAYDRRFAIGLIGSSGKGGAALFRRDFGEGMGNLASSGEYHWFCGNFLKYDSPPFTANDLPVDSHELIALCAPRPVFISEGSPKVEGTWVDDRGQFMAEAAASPVYELLGKKGLGAIKMPPMGTLLMSGDLAFRQHFGPHTDGPNWPYFIEFAKKYFKPLR